MKKYRVYTDIQGFEIQHIEAEEIKVGPDGGVKFYITSNKEEHGLILMAMFNPDHLVGFIRIDD